MGSVIGDILAQESASIGVTLTVGEVRSFEQYAAELKKWNSKVNLTAITKDREIAIKHFIDSLVLTPYLSEHDRLLDIGSGAGLPVIPIKIVRPETEMYSVDAVAKKILFQRHIIRILNLQKIESIHMRVEALHRSHAGFFSIITSRAFTRLDRFVDLASPLLAENGTLIAMKGEQAEGEIAGSLDDVVAAGFEITALHRYTLPLGMGERSLTFLKRCKAA